MYRRHVWLLRNGGRTVWGGGGCFKDTGPLSRRGRGLAQMGNEPEELNISAVCTFDVDQVKVTKMVLDVRGRVPGLDAEGFQSAAEQGEEGCPISNALRGNVDIQLNASLV